MRALLAAARSTLFIATLTVFTTGIASAADKVYKWVDESGNIHYSDIKPNKKGVENVKIRGNKSATSDRSVLDKAKDIDERRSKELEKKAEDLQSNAQARENDARCQSVADNLQKMNESSRVKIDDNGELRYLTPEEVEERKARYRKILDEEC